MAHMNPAEPKFPIRVIFDDGDCTTVDQPDDLFSYFSALDSAAPGVIVRDDLDRNVRVLMTGGEVQVLRIEN